LLVFQKKIVDARPADIQNIVDSWYDMLGWWRENPDKAVTIMAARTSSPVDFYKSFIVGTRIFDCPESVGAFTKSDKMTSLYTSGDDICKFLMDQKQIAKVPDFAAAVNDTFVKAANAKGEGPKPPLDY